MRHCTIQIVENKLDLKFIHRRLAACPFIYEKTKLPELFSTSVLKFELIYKTVLINSDHGPWLILSTFFIIYFFIL